MTPSEKALHAEQAHLSAHAPSDLSPHEQASILIVSSTKNLKFGLYHEEIAQRIARRLASEWAEQAPLKELCVQLAALYSYNKKLATGKYFATLATRLIKAESAPGGPYYNNDSQLDLETNSAIAYLFHLFGKPLPAVEAYVKSHVSLQAPSLSPLTRYFCSVLSLPLSASSTSSNDQRHAERLAEVTEEVRAYSPELRPLALSILKDIERLDTTQEVVLIPYFFADHFPQLDPRIVARASHANIYCWMAYILYDRLLDGDKTPPESLPLMTFAMRRSHALYRQIAPNISAMNHIDTAFNTMDTTNAWEVCHARLVREGSNIKIRTLPRYGLRHPLANRSLGHIIGPQLLAYHVGASSAQRKALQQGLHQFLIARQLHDDIHDWSEDLHNGQASFVVTYLLRKLRVKSGIYPLEALAADMRTEFWRRSLKEINAITIMHATLSKEAFVKSSLVSETGRLMNLAHNLQQAAAQADIEHEKYRTFLQEFKKNSEPNFIQPQGRS